jgi:glycosyltransferase involved in cell wall biosynthesis
MVSVERVPVSVMHILPHRGGGAETYIDALEPLEGFEHRRVALSASRGLLLAAPSILGRLPGVARAASRADLVHVHGDAAELISLLVPLRAPSLWTPQGLHLLRRSGGVQREVVERGLRRAIGRSAAVLCSSQEERRDLEAIGAPSARLRVIANGVAVPEPLPAAEVEELRRGLGLEEGACAVLSLGQLEERKDPRTAVAAVRRAREQGADVVLLLAGSGPLETELRREEGPAVRVLGYRDDAARLLEAADVFVLPSAREGQSFALLEAMSHGLPPVVADGSGNAETVGDAGLVYPYGDAEALAEALAGLASDPAERARVGEAARARARADFSLERFRERVEQEYRAALTAPGRDAADGPA